MIGNQIGKRYAEAIYDIAKSTDQVKPVYETLNTVMELYIKDKEFKNFLDHPLIKKEDKKDFFKKVLVNANPEALKVLDYLVDQGRISDIRFIVSEYLKLYYADNQIVDVEATFAVEPTKEQVHRLTENLKRKTGKTINLVVNIDKSIIGGGIIKIGDEIMDGSIRRQLEILANKK
jgi:F-type H+-transporting ATPase subunit delta